MVTGPELLDTLIAGSHVPFLQSDSASDRFKLATKPHFGEALSGSRKPKGKGSWPEKEPVLAGERFIATWPWSSTLTLLTYTEFAPVPRKGHPTPPQSVPAKYLIFPWGTNDPEEAALKRDTVENGKCSHHLPWCITP